MKLRKTLSFAPAAVVCLLAGCSGLSGVSGPLQPNAAGVTGSVHGGQQPVSGASIQLYTVSTTKGGGTPTALVFSSVVTDAGGGFNLTGRYTCPSSDALVYITATGGNPGLAPGTNNTAIAEMAALGACGSLGSSTFIQINEVTTVAAAMALAPFTTAPFNIGASPSDTGGIAAAFANAAAFADYSNGTSPGPGQSPDPTATTPGVPVSTINTLANIMAACINTAGGVATDTSTPCGMLFSLTGSPTDTMSAMLAVALNPAVYDTNGLFALVSPTAPFQPQLLTPPANFAVTMMTPTGGSSAIVVVAPTVSPGDTVWIAQTGTGCLYGPPTSIQLNGNINTGLVTQLCGVVWAGVPATVPYGIVSGVVTTSTGGQQNNNSYPFYVNVVPRLRSGITLNPTTAFFEGSAGTSNYSFDISLANTTGATLNLAPLAITGPSASYFHVLQSCGPILLSRSGPCTITLYFIPPDTGFYYATLVQTATDSSGQTKYVSTVNLGGSGQY